MSLIIFREESAKDIATKLGKKEARLDKKRQSVRAKARDALVRLRNKKNKEAEVLNLAAKALRQEAGKSSAAADDAAAKLKELSV